MIERGERGATLAEVLVAVAIAGIIFPALTQAVAIGLRTLDSTNKRLAGSNDTFLIASYFTSDVDGASYLAKNGTRAHIAPHVSLPNGWNGQLLSFYAASSVTTVIPPPTQGTVWNVSAATGQLTSSLADEALSVNDENAGDAFARVGTTANVTSSITHTIALAKSGTDPIGNHGESHGAVPNGSSLVIAKPGSLVAGDVMVAHITAATNASKIVAPAGWGTPIEQRDISPALTSLVYVRTAGASEPAAWTWSFTSGTHDIAGGIRAYTNVSTASPVYSRATTANPCGGSSPLLSAVTADRLDVAATGYFLATDGSEHQLVRHACTRTGVESRQVLARELEAASGATASCDPSFCEPLPAAVTLLLRESPLPHETIGRTYTLSARTRTG